MMAVKRIQIRRDTFNNWQDMEGVLADGEMGYDKTDKALRVGDGVKPFSECQIIGAVKREFVVEQPMKENGAFIASNEEIEAGNQWTYQQASDFKNQKETVIYSGLFAEAINNLTVAGVEVQAGDKFFTGADFIEVRGNEIKAKKVYTYDEVGAIVSSVEVMIGGEWTPINETIADAANWRFVAVYVVI